ncbi:MAG: hypothetical protein OXU45_01525 [Candidatus Melainabacteria bacterium]|nr:hypothetical protein [Candidatus Melainabacteria bacterium]
MANILIAREFEKSSFFEAFGKQLGSIRRSGASSKFDRENERVNRPIVKRALLNKFKDALYQNEDFPTLLSRRIGKDDFELLDRERNKNDDLFFLTLRRYADDVEAVINEVFAQRFDLKSVLDFIRFSEDRFYDALEPQISVPALVFEDLNTQIRQLSKYFDEFVKQPIPRVISVGINSLVRSVKDAKDLIGDAASPLLDMLEAQLVQITKITFGLALYWHKKNNVPGFNQRREEFVKAYAASEIPERDPDLDRKELDIAPVTFNQLFAIITRGDLSTVDFFAGSASSDKQTSKFIENIDYDIDTLRYWRQTDPKKYKNLLKQFNAAFNNFVLYLPFATMGKTGELRTIPEHDANTLYPVGLNVQDNSDLFCALKFYQAEIAAYLAQEGHTDIDLDAIFNFIFFECRPSDDTAGIRIKARLNKACFETMDRQIDTVLALIKEQEQPQHLPQHIALFSQQVAAMCKPAFCKPEQLADDPLRGFLHDASKRFLRIFLLAEIHKSNAGFNSLSIQQFIKRNMANDELLGYHRQALRKKLGLKTATMNAIYHYIKPGPPHPDSCLIMNNNAKQSPTERPASTAVDGFAAIPDHIRARARDISFQGFVESQEWTLDD